jgi:endonuclease-3
MNNKKQKVLKIIRALKKLIPNPEMELTYRNNWELLVAVILSAQCTDKKVNEVTEKLFKKYSTLDDYIKADIKELSLSPNLIPSHRRRDS